MSKYKDVIRNIIYESEKHLTAEEIFFLAREKYKGIALATVYNNLNTLESEKEIRKISVSHDADRYDKSTVSHVHLCCKVCKKVSDYHWTELEEILKDKLNENIFGYEFNVNYICKECQNSSK